MQRLKVEKVGDFKLRDIVLIGSLPDMGKVGGLVSGHFAKKLDTKHAAKIVLSDKPWVRQQNGLVELPYDQYNILVDEKRSIVVFTGENQPQEGQVVFELCNLLLSTVTQMGNIKLVISSGGYLPIKPGSSDSVYGVASNQRCLDLLKSHGIPTLGSEINSITWFNGLILGLAKIQNIDGIGLFGQIKDPDLPQYRAAKNVAELIGKILKLQIDTKDLEEKIEDLITETKKSIPGVG